MPSHRALGMIGNTAGQGSHPGSREENTMSWKPKVFVEGKWSKNGLAFATKEEAEANARDLMWRWTLVTDSGAEASTDPVNYSYVDGKLENVGVAANG